MKNTKLEELIESGNCRGCGLGWIRVAYENTKAADLAALNFCDFIPEEQILETATCLLGLGIRELTITSVWEDFPDRLAIWKEAGFRAEPIPQKYKFLEADPRVRFGFLLKAE